MSDKGTSDPTNDTRNGRVPVTHILTLSGRSLQSQPFHRESFYVTGTPPLLTLLAHSSRPSSREPRSAAERLPSARRKVRRGMRDVGKR